MCQMSVYVGFYDYLNPQDQGANRQNTLQNVLIKCQTPKSEHVEAMRSMSPDLELPKIVVQHGLNV